MALPVDLNSVVIGGTYLDPSGAPLAGHITFTPSAQLTDTTGTTVIPAYPKQYNLSAAGKFTTDALVATDNADISPVNWSYLVTLALQNLPTTTWNVELPAAPFSFTATNATPCVFTAAGSAYANTTPVKLAGGSLPAGFTAGTTYFVVSASGTSFSLAATSGGSAIASTSTGSGTVSTASSDVSALTPVFSQLAALQYSQLVLPTSVQSGSITAAAGQLVLVTTASTSATVTLPTGIEAGSQVGVKLVVLGAGNTVTVAAAGSDVFNVAGGPTTLPLSLLNQGVALVYTGSVWVVEGDDVPLAQLDGRYMGNLAQTGVKTSAYNAAAMQLVPCSISGGSFTVTLPTAPAAGTLVGVSVTAVSGVGVNALTVAAGGSDVFDAAGGSTTATLMLLHQAVLWEYNSGVWAKVSSADPYLQVARSRQGTWYLDQFTGTDDAKMASALAAVFAASPAGGTIQLSPRAHTFASQWATTYSAGVAAALKIQGAGVAFNGAWGTPTAATTCAFTYSGGGTAAIDMQHIGTIEITGCQLSNANTGIPLFQTTNATPNLHDNIWSGGASGAACTTDAILLGGTGTSVGAGDTAKYNAYQGRIYGNFFDGIRRACFFQSAANSVLFFENTVSVTCGSNLVLGACIEFQGNGSKTCTGNQVYANCIECTNYPAPIKLTTFAAENTLGPNGLFDASTPTIAHHYFGTPGVSNNLLIDGYHNAPVPLTLDFNQTNRVISANSSQVASESQILNFINRSGPPRVNYFGESPIMVESTGNQAYWRTFPGVNPYPIVNVVTIAATQFTDGNITSGSPYITSATAVFAAADYGFAIGGTGIPTLTVINWAFTATTAIPWAASFANNLGDVIRPKTANSHLYQCTTAGTTGSSTPTFPTGGGTVTDGTAVWTDLGTGITGCVTSVPATATNTGVTIGISRAAGSLQTMTGFSRHHILSSGTAPTVAVGATAQVGTGATASITGNDMCHVLTLNSGTGSFTAGTLLTVTFNIAYTAAPKVMLTPKNTATAAEVIFCGTAAGTWTLSTNTALTASTTYVWDIMTFQ